MDSNNTIECSLEFINSVNSRLLAELDALILSPEAGIQKIRKVLYQFGLDMPALYDASRDGDEVLFDISDYFNDESKIQIYLYFIYYQTEDGNYEFHSELVCPDKLEEFLDDVDFDDDFDDEPSKSDSV